MDKRNNCRCLETCKADDKVSRKRKNSEKLSNTDPTECWCGRANSDSKILRTETPLNMTSDNELHFQEPDFVQERCKSTLRKCQSSRNIVDYLNRSHIGQKYSVSSKMDVEELLMTKATKLCQYESSETYVKGNSWVAISLVSTTAWHPKYTNILAIARTSGNVALWDVNKSFKDGVLFRDDIYPKIICAKFHPSKPLSLYTTSELGKVLFTNFERKYNEVILNNSSTPERRLFSSMDVSFGRKLLLVGDNKGYATFVTLEDQKLQKKLCFHKEDLRYIEFSSKYDYLVATTSLDCTVKLWDLRKISNSSNICQSLTVFNHTKPALSSRFSLADGSLLLTSGFDDEIKVFRSPLWQLQTKIRPSRSSNLRCSYKTNWHPYQDVIAVRNYVYFSSFQNIGLDFYNGHSGKYLSHLCIPQEGIGGLCYNNYNFNPSGEFFVLDTGAKVVLQKSQERTE